MFLYLIIAVLVGFVGYCGVPMVAIAVLGFVDADALLARFGLEAEGPIVIFFLSAYLGMALAAVTAARGPRSSLLAPALVWAVFFLGATSAHLGAGHGAGHSALLHILVSHTLISVLLLGGLVAGGAKATSA